jgi:hypothetical protein
MPAATRTSSTGRLQPCCSPAAHPGRPFGAEAAGDASTIASMTQQRPRATAREDARRIIGSGVGSPQTGNNNHDNDSVR